LLAELEGGHGHDYQVARQAYLAQLANDPNQPAHVRGWIQNQLRQQAQRGGNLHGVPGMDVGHALGKHGQHHPANFRLEWARDNRRRPSLSRRAGTFDKYREFEAELSTAGALMRDQREAEDGPGTARLKTNLLDYLVRQAGGQRAAIRVGLRQHRAGVLNPQQIFMSTPISCGNPDLAYMTRLTNAQGLPVLVRVNIEMDTNPDQLLTHLAQRAGDPQAINVFILTNQATGSADAAWMLDANATTIRPLSVRSYHAALPKPEPYPDADVLEYLRRGEAQVRTARSRLTTSFATTHATIPRIPPSGC
jgi:hypothetical protein